MRTDKLYPFCLCQDEGREVRNLTSEEMRSQQRKKSDERKSERQLATVNDKGSNQPVNHSQSNDHAVF